MANYDAWQAAAGRAAFLRTQYEVVFRQRVALQSQRDTLFAQQGANQDATYKAVEAQLVAASAQEAALAAQIQAADAEAAAQEPTLDEKRTRACADAARARSMKGINPTTQAALDGRCRAYGGTYTAPGGVGLGAPPEQKAKSVGAQLGTLLLLGSPIAIVAAIVKWG